MTMSQQMHLANRVLYGSALVLLFGFGIAVRLYPSSGFTGIGFDENLYRLYVNLLGREGLMGYPQIVETYMVRQRELTYSILPPVRFLYIFASHLWQLGFGADALTSLHRVACLFNILVLPLSYVLAYRLVGRWIALGVLALMACAPTQIHMSQHALVDGFFTFWALLSLWLLWENLQRPNHAGWLAVFGVSLACMVLTKENSFFAFTGMVAIVVANRWLGFGVVTPRLLAVMVLGPLAGVLGLMTLAGGPAELVATYQQSVSKNYTLPYAIKTGDGPWYRYFVDLMLVSPVVLIFAIGEMFRLSRARKKEWFVTIFMAASFLIMCNIKYGMNLRYANMWDMPLRLLAVCQWSALCARLQQRRELVLTLGIVALCVMEVRQYSILFVQHDLYELVTGGLVWALQIVK